MKNELITFKDGTLELNVPVSWEQETVWHLPAIKWRSFLTVM